MSYSIEILNSSLSFVAPVRTPVALDNQGIWLKFNRKLSDWGSCTFRVSTLDPILETAGDILKPFKNHVRIRKGGTTIWQGVIVKNPVRNRHYIEVEARTYLYLLSRVNIRHDAADSRGAENYRTLKSGTMASAITTFLTEAKADMAGPISTLSVGTIDNPTFPSDYKDTANAALTGAWTFSDTFQVRYDYRDILYVIQTLGTYSNFDFELTDSLVFNFKKFVGNRRPELKFVYGEQGNIADYNLPLDGDRMANFIQLVAADNDYNILHKEVQDAASIIEYGKISAVAAYGDVKNDNLLTSRGREELALVKTPDPEAYVTLNNKAPIFGDYGIGDIVTIEVKHHIINVSTIRRIVGISVAVTLTGDEQIKLATNKPRDGQ